MNETTTTRNIIQFSKQPEFEHSWTAAIKVLVTEPQFTENKTAFDILKNVEQFLVTRGTLTQKLNSWFLKAIREWKLPKPAHFDGKTVELTDFEIAKIRADKGKEQYSNWFLVPKVILDIRLDTIVSNGEVLTPAAVLAEATKDKQEPSVPVEKKKEAKRPEAGTAGPGVDAILPQQFLIDRGIMDIVPTKPEYVRIDWFEEPALRQNKSNCKVWFQKYDKGGTNKSFSCPLITKNEFLKNLSDSKQKFLSGTTREIVFDILSDPTINPNARCMNTLFYQGTRFRVPNTFLILFDVGSMILILRDQNHDLETRTIESIPDVICTKSSRGNELTITRFMKGEE